MDPLKLKATITEFFTQTQCSSWEQNGNLVSKKNVNIRRKNKNCLLSKCSHAKCHKLFVMAVVSVSSS